METKSLKYHSSILICFVVINILCGCKKFIEADTPVTSTNSANVYNENSTAAGVLTGIYAKMSSRFAFNDITSISAYVDLSADNLSLFDTSNATYFSFYQNALLSQSSPYWNNLYTYVYYANAAIEGLKNSATLTPAVKQRALGEAYFIRAFCYYYLVTLHGDVPLVLTTDYAVNASLTRSPVNDVLSQIMNDLELAKQLLDARYVDATLLNTGTDRVRPNANAARALLARVLLLKKDFAGAEREATEIISQTGIYTLSALNGVFLKNSSETIWALQPTKTNVNTDEGNLFIPPAGGLGALNPFILSTDLLNAFEAGDNRKMSWTAAITQGGKTYNYPFKYKIKTNSTITEFTIVLRLAEQYLIRAEARAELNNIPGAQSDLNAIRSRAGLGSTTAGNIADLKTAILREKRVEMFTEWGERWLDLKRSGNIDAVMTAYGPAKGIQWKPHMSLFPVLQADILTNNQITQNPGYN
ncbi:RagB/SusD family nutrient uptake outer membrane protein [Pedobacter paludis]|uniref:RagB/SusD family nutrient uptake outer membrane protein n=1 Tax=Pedobacter paludis TaxID=2203212 RepID=A0A317F0K2_9SPHI|nr:RagB/SusD family nutrient uptake outer membrane protein [Pedobacter paludis]PWS32242.1 RagB/SusD family nutrient uptake outer membrane protein [Pedobacter paludis]